MDILDQRIAVFSELASAIPGFGKTALMKFSFLLQRVYKLPLGYDFELYTYGPYCSDVMADIDYAEHEDILSVQSVIFHSGHSGYKITPSKNTSSAIQEGKSFLNKYKSEINELTQVFGQKSARELELSSTIVYMYILYIYNQWETTPTTVSENVHEIKPHFDMQQIETEYRQLEQQNILQRAVAEILDYRKSIAN